MHLVDPDQLQAAGELGDVRARVREGGDGARVPHEPDPSITVPFLITRS